MCEWGVVLLLFCVGLAWVFVCVFLGVFSFVWVLWFVCFFFFL